MDASSTSEDTIPLSDISNYVTEKATFSDISTSVYISTENILQDKQGISSFGTASPSERVTPFQEKDVLVSNIRPYFKKMWFATSAGGCNADVLCFRASKSCYTYLLKSVLYQDCFFDFVMSGAKGTKMPRGDKKHIMQYQVPLISEDVLKKFNDLALDIEKIQAQNRSEISFLYSAQEMLLTTLSR
ncbi:restriction endonuclease subunit S [Eubacterium limosum]|uniref:restriction endonuclease subunit S n=1 Tax=Eubacterium limosum TaxID=1736 RepID=UPI001D089FE9|nr:restriction endonuclease subunit S [Eubacterium limosum]MCB6570553.1 restriction endonuclease subunit S [Eubacterium limosum]